jgi:DNA-directed RNA polymerase specialized sigma24 family protein
MKVIKIKDYYGNYQEIPVDEGLYEEWVKMQNETQRVYRKEMYHRSGTPIEAADEYCTKHEYDLILDDLIAKEEKIRLYEAIESLTPIQRRRVLMYMDHMSYRDIARAEGCTLSSVASSMQIALSHLRRLMRDWRL